MLPLLGHWSVYRNSFDALWLQDSSSATNGSRFFFVDCTFPILCVHCSVSQPRGLLESERTLGDRGTDQDLQCFPGQYHDLLRLFE